jgi:hypothetical protein
VQLGVIELSDDARPARVAVVFIRQRKDGTAQFITIPCLLDSGASTSIMPKKLLGKIFDEVVRVPDRVLRGFNASSETLTEMAIIKGGFLTTRGVPLMFTTQMYVAENVGDIILGNDLLSRLGVDIYMSDKPGELSHMKVRSQPYLQTPVSTDPWLKDLTRILDLDIRKEDGVLLLVPPTGDRKNGDLGDRKSDDVGERGTAAGVYMLSPTGGNAGVRGAANAATTLAAKPLNQRGVQRVAPRNPLSL